MLMVSAPKRALVLLGAVNSLLAEVTGRARMVDRQKAREILQPDWLCDISKAREQLGYSPRYSLERGLAETIRWYEKEGWV